MMWREPSFGGTALSYIEWIRHSGLASASKVRSVVVRLHRLTRAFAHITETVRSLDTMV